MKDKNTTWGRIQGLMAGIALFHLVQPLAFLTGLLQYQDKLWVAIMGATIYSLSFFGLLWQKRYALWIALIGPAVGVSMVGIGFLLSKFNVLELTVNPDVFLVCGGILQIWAVILAVKLLWAKKMNRKSPALKLVKSEIAAK